MMKNGILILGWIVLVVSGCYKDRGNYDYTRKNKVMLEMSPEPFRVAIEDNVYEYQYAQPSGEALNVTYTPVITQDMVEGEDNIAYCWDVRYQRANGAVFLRDTVYTKELTVVFPPRQSMFYTIDLRVTDRSTGVDYWRQLNLKTRFPFVNSWFVLNGQKDDRKLSSIELPDDPANAIITEDAYFFARNVRRFQKAEHIMYAAWQDYNWDRTASLTVIQPDTVSWLYAYGLSDNRPFNMVFSPNVRTKFVDGDASETGYFATLVNDGGKLYYTAPHGFYFPAKVGPDLEGYHVDRMYMSSAGLVTTWDNLNKQLMYFISEENSSRWNVTGEEPVFPSEEVAADDGYLEAYPRELLDGMDALDVLWIGCGITSSSQERGATIIGKENNTVYVYDFGEADDKGDGKGDGKGDSPYSLKKIDVGELGINSSSAFAVSVAYPEQIFYSIDSRVYVLNTISKESKELYDAGAPVTRLQFRLSAYDGMIRHEENNRLAVVVNRGNNEGELHEILLDVAGDVESVNEFTGFGEIQDIVYAFSVRRDRL